jgi:hypothetical protein
MADCEATFPVMAIPGVFLHHSGNQAERWDIE